MVNKDAALALSLSLRQVKRLKKKVKMRGASGAIHGNKVRLPSHAFSPEVRHQIIALAEERYKGFNFSHLSEMLEEEEGIQINRETLRRWLRPLGFGSRIRKMRFEEVFFEWSESRVTQEEAAINIPLTHKILPYMFPL